MAPTTIDPLDPFYVALVEAMAGLILVATFVMLSHKSLGPTIRTYSFQSVVLAALAFVVGLATGQYELWVLAAIALALKGFAIPGFLNFITDKIRIKRERESAIGIPASLLLAGGFVVLAFVATSRLTTTVADFGPAPLIVSVSVVLIGLFIMVSRTKAITQTIGLLVMDNGMDLAALSLTHGMPLLVELGIAFDLLVAAIVVGIFVFQINRTFDTINTRSLERLAE
ncbi:MAG: hydrogenase [Thermoplasmatota archaeon]